MTDTQVQLVPAMKECEPIVAWPSELKKKKKSSNSDFGVKFPDFLIVATDS